MQVSHSIQCTKYRTHSQKTNPSISLCVILTLCLQNAHGSISSAQGSENTVESYLSEPMVMEVSKTTVVSGKVTVLKILQFGV